MTQSYEFNSLKALVKFGTGKSMGSGDPYIFSRGSLKLTYELLRNRHPSLALSVRNELGKAPILASTSESHSRSADCFRVCLAPQEVDRIVSGLRDQSKTPGHHSAVGGPVIAKALLDDWRRLASSMMTTSQPE